MIYSDLGSEPCFRTRLDIRLTIRPYSRCICRNIQTITWHTKRKDLPNDSGDKSAHKCAHENTKRSSYEVPPRLPRNVHFPCFQPLKDSP